LRAYNEKKIDKVSKGFRAYLDAETGMLTLGTRASYKQRCE
jgi:hypothetical protein